jgi:hypothetical protein
MDGSTGDIYPIPRDPLRFDLVQLFSAHLADRSGTLQDASAQGEFFASLGQPLTDAVANPTLLRGLRTEALFGSLVASLGRVHLIKHEDVGLAWTAHRGLKIPDYRIVLPDGTPFLAEVKHFHQGGNSRRAFSISRNYLTGLRTYGEMVGCPVKLAVYWSQWNVWTLVPLSALKTGGRPSLSMFRAYKSNEMGILGDLHVATRFPLRFRIVADPAHARTVGDDGKVAFRIADVEMYCADQRLTGRDWNIAMWFMLYGNWEEEATAEIIDGELVAVNVTRTPQEDHHQGLESIGTLSSLFSSMYLSSTSDADRVTRLGIKVVPGSLGSLIPDDYQSDALPLWRLKQIAEPRRSRGAALSCARQRTVQPGHPSLQAFPRDRSIDSCVLFPCKPTATDSVDGNGPRGPHVRESPDQSRLELPRVSYRQRKSIVDGARFPISVRSAPIPRYASSRSICELAPAGDLAIAVRLVLPSAAAASIVSATAPPIA